MAGLSDEDVGLGGKSVLSDADVGLGGNKPQGSGWDFLTDIPHEIGNEISAGVGKMFPEKSRSELGPLEGLAQTGNRILGAGQAGFSWLTGPAHSIVGHPLAEVENYGRKINGMPADPEGAYERGKHDTDLALAALGAKKAIPNVNFTPAPKPATIGDFSVPLSVGEATGDTAAITEQQAALRNGRGPKAQQIAQERLAEQQNALELARGDIGRNLDQFGQQIVSDPQDAGTLVSGAVQNAAAAKKAQTDALYEQFKQLPGEFRRDAFTGIADRIKNELSFGDNPVIIDDKTTPVASRALADIENNINRLRVQNRADPFGQPDPNDIAGINLQGVDQTRKRLVQFAKDARKFPPDSDTRATRSLIGAFDAQVERALTEGLFSGDPNALEFLKDARASHSQYMKMFNPESGDVANAMKHILGRGIEGRQATPSEVANYLYGTANVGAKGTSTRLAKHLLGIFGEDSTEIGAVRQGLWSRLSAPTEGAVPWGPQKISQRINEFLNGNGKPLADMMFSAPEKEVMQRYAALQKQLIPPPGSVNYSNNLPMLSRISENARGHVGAMVGGHLGGLPGAIAGNVAGRGLSSIDRAMNARRIAKLMPSLDQSIRQWQAAQRVAIMGKAPSKTAFVVASQRLAQNLSQFGWDYNSAMRMIQGTMPANAGEQ